MLRVSINERVERKCAYGELRQTLKKADWEDDEIDFVLCAVKRWLENHPERKR